MDKLIEALNEKLQNMSDNAVFLERKTLLEEAYKKYKYECAAKRFAKSLEYLLDNISIVIFSEDRLAGRIKEELLSPEAEEKYNRDAEENNFQAVKLFSQEPLKQTIIEDPKYRYAPEWFNSWGHCQPDYEKIIQVGITGLIDEVKSKMLTNGLTATQMEFLECSLICLNALIRYIKRLSKEAYNLSKIEKDKNLAENIKQTANCLENITKNKPKSFREGLQIVWLIHFILHTLCGARDYALGRMDKYLYRLYKNDIDNGLLDDKECLSLIEEFAIKCNEIIGRGWEAAENPKRILSVNSLQYIMLSGMDESGNDVTNNLSYIFLDAVNELRLKQPTLCIRWHKKIDKPFLEKAAQIATSGLGYPSFFNDHTVLKALQNYGIAREDAIDYGYYGCNNSILAGQEDELREIWHNVPLYLELALNEGRKFGENEIIGTKTQPVSEMKCINDVFMALKEQMEFGIKKGKELIDKSDKKWNEIKPFAFESIFMTHCIEKASNFNLEGSKYKHVNNHFVGFATTVNSLYSINKIVYQEKRMNLTSLVEILKKDWRTDPKLQQEVVNKFIKYGNDDDDVDEIAIKVSNMFVNELRNVNKTDNGRNMYASIYSLWHHRAMGKVVGATADGRNGSEPLSESQSPTYNTEINGPTALLNSIAKLPLEKTPTGGVNVKFQPSLFKNSVGDKLLSYLINGYFNKGGLQMQINVVDSSILKDAKIHPEKHKNLLVRVVGYSAYFVTLSPEQQDEIIERTELA